MDQYSNWMTENNSNQPLSNYGHHFAYDQFALDSLQTSNLPTIPGLPESQNSNPNNSHCDSNYQEFVQLVSEYLPDNHQTMQECYLNSISQRIGWFKLDEPLRNANYQIRSESFNSQTVVSAWNQSTINPDIRRCNFEINSQKKGSY